MKTSTVDKPIMNKPEKPIREKALVTAHDEVDLTQYPFAGDLPLVYLGEIVNMPEHGIFIGKSGKCYVGYHI